MNRWGMVDMIAEEKAVHVCPVDRNGLMLSPHVAGMGCKCKPVVILKTDKARIVAHKDLTNEDFCDCT